MTRAAILGFHLESNAFAPVSQERHFRSLCYFEGEDIAREARKEAPALPAEVPAFYREMDRSGSGRRCRSWSPRASPAGRWTSAFSRRRSRRCASD